GPPGGSAAGPEQLAGGRVKPLNAAGAVDQLRPAAGADQGRRGHAVAERGVLLPPQLAGFLVQGAQAGGLTSHHDDRVLVQNRAAALTNVDVVPLATGQLFPPDDLAVEIDTDHDAGAEQGEDVFPVGGGGGRRV